MKISVVMATYNGATYLPEQLDSILNQSYTNLELLVVDDCSKDGTRDVLSRYAEHDPRITLHFNQQNLGCSRSFEKGCDLSSGTYIALVDQDDRWLPHKLERLIAELREQKLDLIYSDCRHMDASGALLETSHRDRIPINGLDSSARNFDVIASLNSFVLGCSILMTRDFLERSLPFEHTRFNHDRWLMSNAGAWGKVGFLDEVLFYYRLHGNQYSMRFKHAAGLKQWFKRDMKPVVPFYSDAGYERILSQIPPTDARRAHYERFANAVAKFRKVGLLGRIGLAWHFRHYLYLTQSLRRRFTNTAKLVLFWPGD